MFAQAKDRLSSEGYFSFDEWPISGWCKKCLASWLAYTFSIIYDQYWQLFYSLSPLFSEILGKGYKQVPNFWCWYIDPTNASKGWALHRDRPSANTLMPDGLPATITIWIPLTDANTLNGCMYVLPAHWIPTTLTI